MEPPGTRLPLSNTAAQEIPETPLPSASSRHDAAVNENGLTRSDPIQSSSNAPVVSSSDLHTDSDFGPRYKDQANSVIRGENVNQIAKQPPNVVKMNVDGPPDSDKEGRGPSYKDQVNDSSNEVFLSSNPLSNSEPAANSNSSISVPIVHGILIPPEMLTGDEGWSSGQVGASSQRIGSNTNQLAASTPLPVDMPASDERQTQSENVHDGGKTPTQTSSSLSKDDQIYWTKVIVGAMFLNTLLVACIIVGTFCGIGLCTSASSSAYTTSTSSTTAPTSPPNPQLTPTLRPSAIGSDQPSSVPDSAFAPPTIFGTGPVSDTFAPSNFVVGLIPPSRAPSHVPSMHPIFTGPPTVVGNIQPPVTVLAEDIRSNLIVYIVAAVILEFIVVLACLNYYYQQRRKHQQNAGAEKQENVVLDGANERLEPSTDS